MYAAKYFCRLDEKHLKHNMSGPLKNPITGNHQGIVKRFSGFLDANVADQNKCSCKLLNHFLKVSQLSDNKK